MKTSPVPVGAQVDANVNVRGASIDRRAWLSGIAVSLASAYAIRAKGATLPSGRWTQERAQTWYDALPWIVGCNYIPANAVNQIEMWQASTFDTTTIDRELGWARELGMNSVRVFLHDVVWQEGADGLSERVDKFLSIAKSHGMVTLFVLFDSDWNASPKPGPQPPAKPGVHNSQWVQGPSPRAITDPGQRARLRAYVEGILGRFGRDSRVLAWDVWNEPHEFNGDQSAVGPVHALFGQVMSWARAQSPEQPLTSGLYSDTWTHPATLRPIERLQIEFSDIVSFHDYKNEGEFQKRVAWLATLNRPLFCTEYLARPNGSTFEAILPIAKQNRIAAYNWGLVEGKTQTCYPWSSIEHPMLGGCPPLWFHDVLRPDGQPYDPAESRFLRKITSR